MTPQQIILGSVTFLHDLFTAIWIGGLVFLSISLIPVSKKDLGDGMQTNKLMDAILKTHSPYVYASILGLFITGIIQARMSPSFSGLMRFDSAYSSLITVKHWLTFTMVAIALFRSIAGRKKPGQADLHKMKLSLTLIHVNSVLGVLVLLLSGMLSTL